MMEKLIILAIDAVLVACNIYAFNRFIAQGFSIRNIIFAIFLVIVSLALHCVMYICAEADKTKKIANKQEESSEKENFYDKYYFTLRKMQVGEPQFVPVIDKFMSQIEAFQQKEKALLMIISLNNDSAKEFLLSRNEEVQKFLEKNLKNFMKRLIVYRAKDPATRPVTVWDDSSITKIIDNNNELIALYDKLLDEVSLMGDDVKVDDPGLQNVIESLKELRMQYDDDDDDDGEFELELH